MYAEDLKDLMAMAFDVIGKIAVYAILGHIGDHGVCDPGSVSVPPCRILGGSGMHHQAQMLLNLIG